MNVQLTTGLPTMKLRHYPACDDCAFYICTGDSSHFDYHYESDIADETIATIDATQGSIRADDKLSYWLESTTEIDSTMSSCTFCSNDCIISKAVTAVVKED